MGKEMLTEVYGRLRKRLRAVAGSVLRSDDDIADALQESFCRLWSSREPSSLAEAEGRCIVTVRNVSITQAARNNRMADLDADRMEQTAAPAETDLASRQEYLLSKLPGMQRQVFELVALRDFDYDVAADRLGISEQAARTNLCRARKTLCSLLKNESYE